MRLMRIGEMPTGQATLFLNVALRSSEGAKQQLRRSGLMKVHCPHQQVRRVRGRSDAVGRNRYTAGTARRRCEPRKAPFIRLPFRRWIKGWLFGSTSRPPVVLVTGVSREVIGEPIIGPPLIKPGSSTVAPPARSSTSRSDIPDGDRERQWKGRPRPLTVNVRRVTG